MWALPTSATNTISKEPCGSFQDPHASRSQRVNGKSQERHRRAQDAGKPGIEAPGADREHADSRGITRQAHHRKPHKCPSQKHGGTPPVLRKRINPRHHNRHHEQSNGHPLHRRRQRRRFQVRVVGIGQGYRRHSFPAGLVGSTVAHAAGGLAFSLRMGSPLSRGPGNSSRLALRGRL